MADSLCTHQDLECILRNRDLEAFSQIKEFLNEIQATMDTLTTHPANAQQAKAFTSSGSLSFPGGAGDLTPPSSEKGGNAGQNGVAQSSNANGTGVNPATTAATPAQTGGATGIVPTLQ